MYAITATGYRLVSNATDIVAGETAVAALPATLLATLAGNDVRAQRDALLRACDWTQSADSPLDTTTRTAWATYREALRNLPEQTGFPGTVTWPTPPGA